jgi:hypothetical protein
MVHTAPPDVGMNRPANSLLTNVPAYRPANVHIVSTKLFFKVIFHTLLFFFCVNLIAGSTSVPSCGIRVRTTLTTAQRTSTTACSRRWLLIGETDGEQRQSPCQRLRCSWVGTVEGPTSQRFVWHRVTRSLLGRCGGPTTLGGSQCQTRV